MFCTYITKHPSGHFYIGKSSVERVRKGYTGSGSRLKAAYLLTDFAPSTWTTSVIETFESEADAYKHEGTLVTREVLLNPFCLNDTLGGRRGYGHSSRTRLIKQMKKMQKT